LAQGERRPLEGCIRGARNAPPLFRQCETPRPASSRRYPLPNSPCPLTVHECGRFSSVNRTFMAMSNGARMPTQGKEDGARASHGYHPSAALHFFAFFLSSDTQAQAHADDKPPEVSHKPALARQASHAGVRVCHGTAGRSDLQSLSSHAGPRPMLQPDHWRGLP
jgi:hypothetical protein